MERAVTLLDVYRFSRSEGYRQYAKVAALESRLSSVALSSGELSLLALYPAFSSLYNDRLPAAESLLSSMQDKYKEALDKFSSFSKLSTGKSALLAFYKEALDKLTSQYLDSLSSLLTEVYQSVYAVDSKRVLLGMEDRYGKKVVRMYIVNNVDAHDYKESFEDDGGSAHVLIGLVVSIYFILTTGLPRVMFLDESLGCFHNDVLDRLMGVLRRFSEEMGFTFVLVEHSPQRVEGYVDKVYVVESGVYRPVSDMPAFFSDVSEGVV